MFLTVDPNALKCTVVVLTGKCLNLPRPTLEQLIERANGINSAVVDVDCATVVVAKDWPEKKWATPKIREAIRLGIPILNDEAFGEVLEGKMELGVACAGRPELPEFLETKDGKLRVADLLPAPPAPPRPPIDLSAAFVEAPASPFALTF